MRADLTVNSGAAGRPRFSFLAAGWLLSSAAAADASAGDAACPSPTERVRFPLPLPLLELVALRVGEAAGESPPAGLACDPVEDLSRPLLFVPLPLALPLPRAGDVAAGVRPWGVVAVVPRPWLSAAAAGRGGVGAMVENAWCA